MNPPTPPAATEPRARPRRLWRLVARHHPGPDLLVLGAAALAFFLHCLEYRVVQDDAYISFAYARNLALGNGLVFNPGERVEGYTNFLWTMIHVVPHLTDVDVVITSQVLGCLSALGLLATTWLVGRRLRPHRPALAHTPAVVLLAANGALAFWTLSGMETLLFALLVALGVWSYLGEGRGGRPAGRTGLLFGLAALTRPEGLLFFGLTGLHRLALQLRGRRFTVREHIPSVAPFLALVVPHFVFRLAYYGYPLPNTFYAKTGLELAYLTDGLSYTWKFLVDYGFWGLALAAPLALMRWRRQRAKHAYLGVLIWGNALYVTAVGGDTMAENRLFLPMLALVYVELQELGYRLAHWATVWLRHRSAASGQRGAPIAVAVIALLLAGHYTFHHARPALLHAKLATEAHNGKLFDLAAYINTCPTPGKLLVASTAIGIPRYFTAAAVLDLVGLTDETIAHRPQPLPGIRSDHRLRNYNVAYVMDRAPDLIFFITGEKPATPAEKALFTSRRFRRGYYLTYIADDRPVFSRLPPGSLPDDEAYANGDFVELYARALAAVPGDSARALLRAAIDVAPPDFACAHAWLGRELFERFEVVGATAALEEAVARDSNCVMARAHLAILREVKGRAGDAVRLARRAVELAPRSHFSHYAYGRALLAAGRTAEGQGELLEALRLDDTAPSAPDAGYRLGLAHYQKGDARRARLVWEAVLRADPTHEGARLGLQVLDRQRR